jgi:methylenetetrahydrofolate reductase (NADPH)
MNDMNHDHEDIEEFEAHFSFEFFPPKTDAGFAKLADVRDRLAAQGPEFFSVTYGAGGSTRERTFNAVKMVRESGVDTAPHLSCVGHTRAELREIIDGYKAGGVTRIIALRGDLPSGMGPTGGELPYARDLVEFIRKEYGNHFSIEVAAYPEMHPQAANLDADIANFVAKVKAGANSAITQYFFNPDSYFHFVDRVQDEGITIPIVPGIMPITNVANLIRFSDGCGAEVPRWLRKQLEVYADDEESVRLFGIDVVSALCETLVSAGAPGLHFYTMNQAEPTLSILRNLGVPVVD